MASAGVSAVKIIDNDSDVVGVTGNALDVHIKTGTSTIDIGDVSLLLDGTAADYGTGNVNTSGRTLRVTLASDDVHFGAVGGAADIDGTIHGQLRYIGNSFSSITTNTGTTATNSANIALGKHETGTDFDTSDIGFACATVRNDTLANLDGNIANGDYTMLQTNDIGALYVTGESKQQTAVTDYGLGIMGEAKIIDGSALPNTVGEGNAARLAMSRSGIAYTCLTDDAGASDLGTTITTHLSEIEGAVETIEGAIDTQMQVDVVAALPAGTNAIGKVGHDITGGADGVKTVSNAGTDEALALSIACKKVDIQAQTDNTGLIAVGFTGVDATEATGTGVILRAGDTYSLEIDNLVKIFIDATVSGEGVRYTYFT